MTRAFSLLEDAEAMPPAVPPVAPHSSGARALALLMIGLFLGAMLMLVAIQTLQQKSGYVDGLMAVLQHHHAQLRTQVRRGQCEIHSAQLSLQRLTQLTPDIATALAKHGALVQSMTDDLARAVSSPADLCAELPKIVSNIDSACKACHSQLR